MAKIFIILAALACIFCHSVRAQSGTDQPQCSQKIVSTSKVTINNTYDEGGKAIASVVFDKAAHDTDSWLVDVERQAENCEGVQLSSRLVYTLTVPRRAHGSGYELFPGLGFYKFHPEVATWPRAREICSEEDAHLVILNSEQESTGMVKLIARFPTIKGSSSNDWFWVGLQERASAKGLPYTIFGEAVNITGFDRWSPSEPNNPTLDDFMLMNRHNGGYADVPIASSWKQAFICEQEL